ncbi:DUF1330 domain-containing protein [Pseudoalteromonas denitrificans]|uniref:Uncharacterized conserved protein, DUF1330 family n=1 Tax=Pseudoalteromonas denitrificans DSM 6059 TaxID=1123010 RepID=A0A1I1G4V8_9GAMM|nr:DUF1330 domain-containing protein [Pseudoalteromonas denitrificans]SFC06585.1 Uncharacterized conserved protein, DUF1330 family [Pseudoalteromonas denitrificans DSM 6059]
MYEMLVGLNVTDDEIYTAYRVAMKPILVQYGGGFSSDFKVSETLVPTENNDINRVFTIYFTDKTAMENFFSNPEYLAVKNKFFEKSVSTATILSSYTKV